MKTCPSDGDIIASSLMMAEREAHAETIEQIVAAGAHSRQQVSDLLALLPAETADKVRRVIRDMREERKARLIEELWG